MMLPSATDVHPRVALCKAGLVLGIGTRLAQFADATDRLAVDHERLEAMFAVAFQRAPSDRDLSAIEAASTHWQRGDKALANLRLVFADLPRLETTEDAVRLKAAELLFDAGLRADDLAKAFGVDPPGGDLEKYDPNQPRVPAGSGKESGRWAALWSRLGAWLDEEVPEYDNDFGTQVGTRSRARAILVNPLTWLGAGVAMLVGTEVLLPAAAVLAVTAPEAGVAAAATEGVGALTGVAAATEGAATIVPIAEGAAALPVVEEAEALTPFAQRYLSTSGGRLGNTATRKQLHEIAQRHVKTGRYNEYQGDGMGPEEYIRGSGPGTRGSTYVDFTAKAADGATVRVQTVNTLADGVTPTADEIAAAACIRAARPMDKLILVPKGRP